MMASETTTTTTTNMTADATPQQPSGRALKALWYDGLSSRPQRVLVMIEPSVKGGPQLVIQPLEPHAETLRLGPKQLQWPQTYGRGNAQNRLTVNLLDHGTLEVQSAAQWHEAYAQAGGKRRIAERLQTGWKILFGFTLASLLVVFVFFRYGTPLIATQLARFAPLEWELSLGNSTLEQLDRFILSPTSLSEQRQMDLRERFNTMLADVPTAFARYGSYQPVWKLEFRSGIGANALALPGGTLIMTDEMVELAQKEQLPDDAVFGVVAHEIGHVMHRHSSRMLIEQGVLNATLSMAVGDVSGWLAVASTTMTSLSYTRNHEREADCFALALMQHQQIDTKPMAQLFAAATGVREKKEEKTSSSALSDWLSTHPDSGLRTAAFHEGQAAQCDLTTGRLK